MIIRDSRSPRGRYEDSGPSRDFDRLQACAIFPVLPQGTTWKTLNRRSIPKAPRLPRATAQQRRTYRTWFEVCALCNETFETARANAQYCGDRCRQRACKARKRATRA